MADLVVTRRNATEIWTLDRPAQRNALSRGLLRELGANARRAAADPSVRVVIVTGAGDQVFCAGADLKERRGMSVEDVRDMLAQYRTELGFLDALPKPVVAAVNGLALGGGLELALCCDFRVLAAHAEVGLTEVSLGIVPGAGGTQRLPRLVGEARAKEMLLFARRIGAQQAFAWGLANHVAAPGQDVVEAALAWAEPLERAAPIAVASALEAIDAAMDLPLDAGLAAEVRCYERTLVSEDRLEALAAFAEKRPPSFQGR